MTAIKDGLFLLDRKLHRCNRFFYYEKGLSNDLNRLKAKIQTGESEIITLAGNEAKDVVINFSQEFGIVPSVQATAIMETDSGVFTVAVKQITKTGFKARVSNSGAAKYSGQIGWMAIL